MNFDMNKLRQELTIDEGKSLTTYVDSMGFKTIGIGHLQENQSVFLTITEEECDDLFAKDISIAEQRVKSIYPELSELVDARQRVLLNMGFNLGNKLAEFVHFLADVKSGNYSAAAAEMLNSLWAKQVGQRAIRLSAMMKNGV